MPSLPPISLRIKGDALGVALQRKFRSVARQTPAYADRIVNKACNSISFKAAQTMPVASIGNIDRELEVGSTFVTRAGKLPKTPGTKTKWRKFGMLPPSVAGVFVNSEDKLWSGFYQASLAIRITLARFYSHSRYNVTTGQVWALQKPGTRGQMAFWQWIYDTAERMVKSRHKSIAFYKACAVAVNVGFGAVLGKFGEQPSGMLLVGGGEDSALRLLSRGLAKVEPSRNGQGHAKFSVLDTEPDTKGRSGADFAKNALPVWQRAVEAEAASINVEVNKRLIEAFTKNGILLKV